MKLRLLLSLGNVVVASSYYGPSSPSSSFVQTVAASSSSSAPMMRMSVDLPPPLRSTASHPPRSLTSLSSSFSSSSSSSSSSTTIKTTIATTRPSRRNSTGGKVRTLGLLTFDLDDSLYPIEPVLSDANSAFVGILGRMGYVGSSKSIGPEDVAAAGRRIREEAGPVGGAAMTHTEVRMRAIRGEMERCADGRPVSEADVERVYSAWERERHHSAERHLYPEAISTLRRIREEHPDVVIGAVTDGKANPLRMVFTLAPYFDFCTSWEDDASGRTGFFKELSDVGGRADLQWIYKAAYEKYADVASSRGLPRPPPIIGDGDVYVDENDDVDRPAWIHVGDDLAYDVGGSASCGADTVLLDLDKEYRQTAKTRFVWGSEAVMPSWNTASGEEIANRKAMNDAAETMVDKRVSRLSMLADAIDEILMGE